MADKQNEDDKLQRGSTMHTPATWRDIRCAGCGKMLCKSDGGRVEARCPRCGRTETYN